MRKNAEKHRARSESSKKRRALIVESANIRIPDELSEICDIPYEIENGSTLMTDIVMPKNRETKPLPVIVFLHGGALLFGSSKANRRFRYHLAGLGYIVYSLGYRTIDETDFCGEISDVCRGLQLVKDTITEYNGDPDRISIIGESAGGLLALYAAAMTRSKLLQNMIHCTCPDISVHSLILSGGMLYTTRPDYIAAVYKKDLYGDRRKDREFMKLMNPEHPEVMKNLPKVCLVSARGDFLHGATLRYASALHKADHPSLLLYYADGKNLPHAFVSLCPSLPESREALKKIHKFIESS